MKSTNITKYTVLKTAVKVLNLVPSIVLNLVNLVDQASGFSTTAVWALGQLYTFVVNLRYWRTQVITC